MVDRQEDDSNPSCEKESNLSDIDKQSPTFENFELLIEDRTFVDYFNVFLSLPVFGQRAIYDVFEEDFEFNPLVRRRREFIHRRGVFQWLYNERYPLFCGTNLYMEYLLCCNLRDLCLLFQSNCPDKSLDLDNPIASRNFTSNLIGHVMGMQIFRESLKGTSGEKVFQCCMDIEKLKCLPTPPENRDEIQRFKDTYLRSGSKRELLQRYKNVAYHGFFNFDIIPEADEHILQESELRAVHVDTIFDVDTLDTLVSLQTVLLRALKRYWLPRHVIHVLSTESLDVIRDLFETDTLLGIDFNQIKNILKCRKLFPRVSSSHIYSTDTLLISPVTDDLSFSFLSETPEPTPGPSEPPKPTVTDLLALCGGMRFNISTRNIAPEDVKSPSPNLERKQSSNKSERSLRTDSSNTEIPKSSVTDLLEITSDSKLTEESVRKTLLSGITSPEQETMPLILKNFIYGLRVVDPVDIRISDRILYGIASDHLAGFPFRKFLTSNQMHLELLYLSFWNDIHKYTQVEEDNEVDNKQELAKTIINKYFRSQTPSKEIFNESLKEALIDCLSTGNNESLLYFSHDIVSSSLHVSWRKFIKHERRNFATICCGKRHNEYMRSFCSSSEEGSSFSPPSMSPRSTPGLTSDTSYGGTSYFRDPTKSPYELLFGANNDDKFFWETPSIPSESVDVLANETACFRSFEYAIMIFYPRVDGSEFNTIADICRNMKKPRGSLHVEIQEPVRQKWLAELVNPKKINIEELAVSRFVEGEDYGFRAFAPEDISDGTSRPPNRMVIRRNGMMMFQPCKPRSFMEVLMNPIHLEFFRRYMISNDAMTPLLFWKAVEDMKNTRSPQGCQIKAYKIFKRFFGKQAKDGEKLDSKDEIIKLLSTVTKASPGMLICAQTCIYRMMERKWYPGYLETFPTDAELKDVHMSVSDLMLDGSDSSTSASSWAPKKKVYKKKTHHLWHGFLRLIQHFLRALKNRSEMRLFEYYLKKVPAETSASEGNNEQASNAKKSKEATQSSSGTANNTNDSRVILRSKVVAVTKLPRDLQFWVEVTKFREQYSGMDYAKQVTKEDEELLMEKAKAIVSCFLQSEVSPRVQVNVPADIALAASNNLHMHGPQRGLFHDATVVLFPIIYHYWRRFKDEWLSHESPDKYMKKHEEEFREKVARTPHGNIGIPDYTKVHADDLHTYVYSSYEDGYSRINFTIMHGIRILLPRNRGTRSEEFEDLDVDASPSKLRSPGRNATTSRLSFRRRSGREFSSLSLASKEGTVGDHKGVSNRPSVIQEIHSSATMEKLQTERNNRRMSVLVEKVKDNKKMDAKDMASAVTVAMKKPVTLN